LGEVRQVLYGDLAKNFESRGSIYWRGPQNFLFATSLPYGGGIMPPGCLRVTRHEAIYRLRYKFHVRRLKEITPKIKPQFSPIQLNKLI
jgi:hypothetical protein